MAAAQQLTNFLIANQHLKLSKDNKSSLFNTTLTLNPPKSMLFNFSTTNSVVSFLNAYRNSLALDSSGISTPYSMKDHFKQTTPNIHKFVVDFELPLDVDDAILLLPLIRSTIAEFLIVKQEKKGGEEGGEDDAAEDGLIPMQVEDDVDIEAKMMPIQKAIILGSEDRYRRIIFPDLIVTSENNCIIVRRIAAFLAAHDKAARARARRLSSASSLLEGGIQDETTTTTLSAPSSSSSSSLSAQSQEYRWQSILTNPKKLLTKSKPAVFDSAYSKMTAPCTACSNAAQREVCIVCGQLGHISTPERIIRIQQVCTFKLVPELHAPEHVHVYTKNEVPTLDDIIASSLITTLSGTNGIVPDTLVEDEVTTTPDLHAAAAAEAIPLRYPAGTPHCPGADGRATRAFGGLWGGGARAGWVAVGADLCLLVEKTVHETFDEYKYMVFDTGSVFINKNGNKILAYGKGIGSNYCLQKGKDHKDSYIWFEITKMGIKQLCASKEMVRMKECKHLCRNCPYRALPNSRIRSFFPNCTILETNVTQSSDASLIEIADMATNFIKKRREDGAFRKLNVYSLCKPEKS